jgi:hypothetical protein
MKKKEKKHGWEDRWVLVEENIDEATTEERKL